MLGKKRMLIWGGLALGLVGAVVLLLLAQQRRQAGGNDGTWEVTHHPEPQETEYLEIRIVDEAGNPVPSARLWAFQDPSLPRAEPLGAPATYRIAAQPDGVQMLLQARGFRAHEVRGVKQSGDVVLPRGIVIRVLVRGRPVLPGAPYRLYFQVRPEPGWWTTEQEFDAGQLDALVGLLDSVIPPPQDVQPSTRKDFGYEVSQDQAEAGILLPRPGRYDIRWGLFDVERQLWYSLESGTTTTVDVKDQKAPQIFDVSVKTEAVDRTRRELDAVVDAAEPETE